MVDSASGETSLVVAASAKHGTQFEGDFDMWGLDVK